MTADELLQQALAARDNAYAPYSHYAVGAALLCADGCIFTGSNVENASYGLTMCAERNAVFHAVAEGRRDFCAIAVCGAGDAPAYPCGACLQVMAEFAPEMAVYVGDDKGKLLTATTVQALLPTKFKLSQERE